MHANSLDFTTRSIHMEVTARLDYDREDLLWLKLIESSNVALLIWLLAD